MQRIVIIGATSGIAEQCARLWVARGPVALTLVGRDLARLERVAADLRVRGPASTIDAIATDLVDRGAIETLVDRVSATPVDVVLVAHGSLPDQDRCQDDLAACEDALVVNGLSPVLFAEAFAARMAAAGRGTLCLIGSVAGDRGRRSNYTYGAAKGLVTRYAQGLQHRFAGSAVRVVLVKPGPTATPMTAHLAKDGAKLAPAADVAAAIVKAIDRGQPVVYAPAKWQLIMMVIRHLPRVVFDKMNI